MEKVNQVVARHPNGPTMNDVMLFIQILPAKYREWVQVGASDDDEICLSILRNGKHFSAILDIDPKYGLYVTWLHSDNGTIIPGESHQVEGQQLEVLDRFKNAVITIFS